MGEEHRRGRRRTAVRLGTWLALCRLLAGLAPSAAEPHAIGVNPEAAASKLPLHHGRLVEGQRALEHVSFDTGPELTQAPLAGKTTPGVVQGSTLEGRPFQPGRKGRGSSDRVVEQTYPLAVQAIASRHISCSVGFWATVTPVIRWLGAESNNTSSKV